MVRETRYLRVADLPKDVTEESLSDQFLRFGKIQTIRIDKTLEPPSAVIAFLDIKAATKAHCEVQEFAGKAVQVGFCDASGNVLSKSLTFKVAVGPGLGGGCSGAAIVGPGSSGAGGGGPVLKDLSANALQVPRPSAEPPANCERKLDTAATTSAPGSAPVAITATPPVAAAIYSLCNIEKRFSGEDRLSAVAVALGGATAEPRSPVKTPAHRQSVSRSSSRSSSNSRSSSRNVKGTAKVSSGDSRPNLGIRITRLPLRSTDSSLRDGLFHEYKKHGKVTHVAVSGQGDSRQAVVSFKKHEDATKALEASQGKLFFGAKIKVIPDKGIEYAGEESDDETNEVSEYSQKATRTLFVGNLEKDVSLPQLEDTFKNFGTILDIDIKKQGAVSAYAFVQYTDIASVVRAMRSMDGCHIGSNKIKLGFGKSMPTSCVWVEGLTGEHSEKYLRKQFAHYGVVTQLLYDKRRSRALVHYDTVDEALSAFQDLKNRPFLGKRLQVDFASRDCQTNFKEILEAKVKPPVRHESGSLAARNWSNDSSDERYDDYQGRMRYLFHEDGDLRKVNRGDRSRTTEETDKDSFWRYSYSRVCDEKVEGKRKRSGKDPAKRRVGSTSPLSLLSMVASRHSSASNLHLRLDSSRSPSPSSGIVSHRKMMYSGGIRGVSPLSSRPSRSSSNTPPLVMATVETLNPLSGGRCRSATPPTPTKDERHPDEPRPTLVDSEERLRNGGCTYRKNLLYAAVSGSEMVATSDRYLQRGPYRDELLVERSSSQLPTGSSMSHSGAAGSVATWAHVSTAGFVGSTSSSSGSSGSRLRVAVAQSGHVAVAASSADEAFSDVESTGSGVGSTGGDLLVGGGQAEQHELVLLQEKKQQLLSMIEQLGDDDDDDGGGGACGTYDDDGRDSADVASGGVADFSVPSAAFGKLPTPASAVTTAADGGTELPDEGGEQKRVPHRLTVHTDDSARCRSMPPLAVSVPASGHKQSACSPPQQQLAMLLSTGLSKLASCDSPSRSLGSTLAGISRDDGGAPGPRRSSLESCQSSSAGVPVRGSTALQHFGELAKQVQQGSGVALIDSAGSSHSAAMSPDAKRRKTVQDSVSPTVASAVESSSSRKKKKHHSDRSQPSKQPSKVHRVLAAAGTRSVDDDGRSSTSTTKAARASRRGDPTGGGVSSAGHSHQTTPAEIPLFESAFFTKEVVAQINDLRLCKCKLRAAAPDLPLPKFSQTVVAQPPSPMKSKPSSPPTATATMQSLQPKSPPLAVHRPEPYMCDNDDGARTSAHLAPVKAEPKDLRTSGCTSAVSPPIENGVGCAGRLSYSSPVDHANHSDVELDSSGSVEVSSRSNVPGSSPTGDDAADIEKRIRALDEKLRQAEQQHPADPPKPPPPQQHPMDIYSKYRIRKKSDASSLSGTAVLGVTALPAALGQPVLQPTAVAPSSSVSSGGGCGPSAIGQTLLSRSSIFDHDIKRLENIDEKYEARLPGYSSSALEVSDVQQPIRVFKTKAAAKELPASILTAGDGCSSSVIVPAAEKPGSLPGQISLLPAVFGRPVLPVTELLTISPAESAIPVPLLLPQDSVGCAEASVVPVSWQQLPTLGLLSDAAVVPPPPVSYGYSTSPLRNVQKELVPDATASVAVAAPATATGTAAEQTYCVQPLAGMLTGSRQHSHQVAAAKLTAAGGHAAPLVPSGHPGESCLSVFPAAVAAVHHIHPSGDVASPAAGSSSKPSSDLRRADGTKLSSTEPVATAKQPVAVTSTTSVTAVKPTIESSSGLSKVGFSEGDSVLTDRSTGQATAAASTRTCCVSDSGGMPAAVQQLSKEKKSDKKRGSKKTNDATSVTIPNDLVKGNADALMLKGTTTIAAVLPGNKSAKKETTDAKEKNKRVSNDEQLSTVLATEHCVQPTGDALSAVATKDAIRPVMSKDRCRTKGDSASVAVAADVKFSGPAVELKHGNKNADQVESKSCGYIDGGSNALSSSNQGCDKKKKQQSQVLVSEENQCTAARVAKGTGVASSGSKSATGLALGQATTSTTSVGGAAPASCQTALKHEKHPCSPSQETAAVVVHSKKAKEQLEERMLLGTAASSKDDASKERGKRSHAPALRPDERSGHVERKDHDKKEGKLDVKKEGRPDKKKVKLEEKKELQVGEKKELKSSPEDKKFKASDQKEERLDEKKEPKVDAKKTQRTDDTKEIKSDDPADKPVDRKETKLPDKKDAIADGKTERKSGEAEVKKERTADKKGANTEEIKGTKSSDTKESKLDDKKRKQLDDKKPIAVSQAKERKEADDDEADSHADRKKKDKENSATKKCSTGSAITHRSKDVENPHRPTVAGLAAPPKAAKSSKSADGSKTETAKLKATVSSDSAPSTALPKPHKSSETSSAGKRKRHHSSSCDEVHQHEKPVSKKRAVPDSSDDEQKTAHSRSNGGPLQPTEKTEQQKKSWMEEYAPFLVNESMYDKVKRRSSTLAQAKQVSGGSDTLAKNIGDLTSNIKKSAARSNSTGGPAKKLASSRRSSVDESASSDDETGADSDSSASVIGPSRAKRTRQQQQRSEASSSSRQHQRKRSRRTISSSEEEEVEKNDAKEVESETKKKPLVVAPLTLAATTSSTSTHSPKKCTGSKSANKKQRHAASSSASASVTVKEGNKVKMSGSRVRTTRTTSGSSDEEQEVEKEESFDGSSTADSSSSSDESDGKASSLQKKKALAKMARLPSGDQQDGGDESIAASFAAVAVKKEVVGNHIPSKKQQSQQKQLPQKPQPQKQQPVKPKPELQQKTRQDEQQQKTRQDALSLQKQNSGQPHQKQPELSLKQPILEPPMPLQPVKQQPELKQKPNKPKPQQPLPLRASKKPDPPGAATLAVSATALEKRVPNPVSSSSSSDDDNDDSSTSNSGSSTSGSSTSSSSTSSSSSSEGDGGCSDGETSKELGNGATHLRESHATEGNATLPVCTSGSGTFCAAAASPKIKCPLVKSEVTASLVSVVPKRAEPANTVLVANCAIQEPLATTLSASSSDSESDIGETESDPALQPRLTATRAVARSPTHATAQLLRDEPTFSKPPVNAVPPVTVTQHEKPSPTARDNALAFTGNGSSDCDVRSLKASPASACSATAASAVAPTGSSQDSPPDTLAAVCKDSVSTAAASSSITSQGLHPAVAQHLPPEAASSVDVAAAASSSFECSSAVACQDDTACQPASPKAAAAVTTALPSACDSNVPRRDGRASDAWPCSATYESEARRSRLQHVQPRIASPPAAAEVRFDGDASRAGLDGKGFHSESSHDLLPVPHEEEESDEIAVAAASVQNLLSGSAHANASSLMDVQSTGIEARLHDQAPSQAVYDTDAEMVDEMTLSYRGVKNVAACEEENCTDVEHSRDSRISASSDDGIPTVTAAPAVCESAVIRWQRRPLTGGLPSGSGLACAPAAIGAAADGCSADDGGHTAEELAVGDDSRVDVQKVHKPQSASPSDATEAGSLLAKAFLTSTTGIVPQSSGAAAAACVTVKCEAEEWPADNGGAGLATAVASTPPPVPTVVRSLAPQLQPAPIFGTSGLGTAATGPPATAASTIVFSDTVHAAPTPVVHRTTAGNEVLLPPSTARTSLAPSVAVVSPRTSQTASDLLVDAHFKAALKGSRERTSNAFMESLKVEVPVAGEKMFDNLTPGGASRSMFSLPSVIKVQKSDTPCVSPLSSLSPHVPASPAPVPCRSQPSVGLPLPTSQSPYASSSAAAFMAAVGASHHQHVISSELSPLAPFIASMAPAAALDSFRQQLPHHGLDSRSMIGLMQQPFFATAPSAHYSSALMHHHPVTAGAGVLCPPMGFVGQLPLQNPTVAAAAAAVMQQQPGMLDDPCGDLFRGHMAAAAAVAAGLANPLQHIVDVGRMSQYHLQKQQERLLGLLQRYPVAWKGTIALKSDTTSVEMRYVSGSRSLPGAALPLPESGLCLLRVAQRMRLEQPQLDAVARRMEQESDYSLLLVVPSGNGIYDSVQSDNMNSGFIQYLQQKEAAGIINVSPPGSNTPAYVVHIFPPCEFSDVKLREAASELQSAVRDFPHLVVIIATVA